MIDLLKLLREAIGIKPIVPVVLIILVGLLFKGIREYPLRELLHDRWFLLTVLGILTVSLAHAILTSGLAERTHTGRLGVYVARLKGDPSAVLQAYNRNSRFEKRNS